MTVVQPKNRLFPVFIKLEQFNVLIVGGGLVALEKLNALLNNSPDTAIRLIAKEFHPEVLERVKPLANVTVVEKAFDENDLTNIHFIITALNDAEVSSQIAELAHRRRILINAADKPELCDFYLGAIVQKGDLKIAISTNGKSPTMARRMKDFFNEIIPGEIEETLENIYAIRSRLKGNLHEKIRKLNELTKSFVSK
jgi:siroheme synthase-like protein